MTELLEQLVAELGRYDDVVAHAWARHFANDLRAFRLWAMAHQDDEVTTTGGRINGAH